MKKEQVFSDSHRVGRFFDMNNYRAQAFRFCNSITDGLDSAFTLPEEFFFLEATEKKRAKNPEWDWYKTDFHVDTRRHTGIMHDENGKRVPKTVSREVVKLYCVRNSKGVRRYKFDVQIIKVFPGLWVSNNPGNIYSNTDTKVKSVNEVLKRDKEFKPFSLRSDTVYCPLIEFHPFKLTSSWWSKAPIIEDESFEPSSEFLNMIFGNLDDAMTFIGRVAESYESNDFSKYTK